MRRPLEWGMPTINRCSKLGSITMSRASQMISLGQSIEGSATISPFSRKESILLMTAMVAAL